MLFNSQWLDLRQQLPWIRINNEKKALRALDGQKRRVMDKEMAHTLSRQIVEQIEQMHCFREAHTVMIYYPIHNEVDLRHLVHEYADDKIFLLPATLSKSRMEVRQYIKGEPLIKGRFGIPEPNTPAYTGPIDLILVPGVAFDHHCHRLGRGGGYYDRFLKNIKGAVQVGVCYDFQLHDDIPHGWRDQPMQRVVTPTQTIQV
ncbi:MAG: 5-formyltetrahydrofolate cyclo-ligase [Paludibacteraceae bacterium]|nr:5-formyltetrahydrofolate cyclo-ligase [Paludibacteraceae bacterium]